MDVYDYFLSIFSNLSKLCNQTYKCIKNSIKNILIYIDIDPVSLIEEL